MARTSLVPVSILLLPLAFGSQLGGMITLIGTPPNLIVSAFREEHLDSLPCLILTRWDLVLLYLISLHRPGRMEINTRTDWSWFKGRLLLQFRITYRDKGSRLEPKYAGKALRDIIRATNAKITIIRTLIRGSFTRPVPYMYERIKADDILIVQAALDDLKKFLLATGFQLEEHVSLDRETIEAGDRILMEATVRADSLLLG